MAKTLEMRRWLSKPFTTGTTAPTCRPAKRKSEVKFCASCGSASIIGGDLLCQSSKQQHFFCDIQCAGDYKRYHNKTQEYREKFYSSEYGFLSKQSAELRKANRDETIKNRWKSCLMCGCAYSGITKHCKACSVESRRNRCNSKRAYEAKPKSFCVQCERCGITYHSHRSSVRFCSDRCRKKAAKRNREHTKRSRAFGSIVSLHMIKKKHKGKCIACGIKCTKPDGNNLPTEATMDHIQPLALGGLHIASNVQLMCRECNWKKNDSMQPGTQLMLALQLE